MSKYCGNCGNEVPEGMRFCGNCGKPVAQQEQQTLEQERVATIGDGTQDARLSAPPQPDAPNLPPPPQPEPPPINVPPPPQQRGSGRKWLILGGGGCALVVGLVLLLVIGLALLGGSGGGGGGGMSPPTEEEVQQTIERSFTETYSNQAGGPATYEDVQVSFAFGPMEVGDLTEHQMDYDEPVPSYPVRMPVEVTTTYSFEDGTTSSDTAYRGDHPENPSAGSDVFWFYVDEFGEWNFRTGSA